MEKYALIEVMACPGGCIGGGGQPRTPLPLEIPAKRARIEALYQLDTQKPIRASWEIRNYRRCMRNSWESPAASCPKRCFIRSTSINITFWERKIRFSPFSNKRFRRLSREAHPPSPLSERGDALSSLLSLASLLIIKSIHWMRKGYV